MNTATLVGYTGSVIVLISLLMKSLVKLRWINLIGSLLLAVYGFLIRAWPVSGINAVIAGIDAWYLIQMVRCRDYFELAPLAEIGPDYFKKFFLYHERDIQLFFPKLQLEKLISAEAYMLFRNMLPVGFFAFQLEGEEARVVADYVIPEYRDFQVGRFVYEIKRLYFKQKGIRRFVADSGIPKHRRYLRRTGFLPDSMRPGLYVKAL